MGLINWWLTHGPGSPGSIAKAITKNYNKFRSEFPIESENEILRMVFEYRLSIENSFGLPHINENEATKILNQVINGSLKELVIFFVHRENPEADKVMLKQRDVYFSMLNVIKKVIKKYKVVNVETIHNKKGEIGGSITQGADGRSSFSLSKDATSDTFFLLIMSIISNSFTEQEKDIFSEWAGLKKGEWSNEHKKIFENVIYNHLYDGKLGKVPLPPALQANAKFLKVEPDKPIKPLTDDIRTFLNSLF